MTDTPNLALPYILAAQAQKHVTHNEALRALDCLVQLCVVSRSLTEPPASPDEGSRYIVGSGGSDAWAGQDGNVAAFQDGAWAFYSPRDGWLAWVMSEGALIVYEDGAWSALPGSGGEGGGEGGGGLEAPVANASLANMVSATIKGRVSAGSGHPEDLSASQATAILDVFMGSGTGHKKGLVPDPGNTEGTTKFLREDGTWAEPPAGDGGSGDPPTELDNLTHLGVNATGDTTNRLSLKSPASLFDNEGAGHQQKINKKTSGDTASVLYQTNYSGRAEMGLAGDDDFHFKVSGDGASWHEAIKIDRASGRVDFPNTGSFPNYRNRIVNPSGVFAQAGLANTSDAGYTGFDQWLALTQSNAVTPSQLTAVADGLATMMRMNQANSSAQRMGWLQPLEASAVADLRGKTVALQFVARMSVATTLRYAIVEWTGTADTITKDIVADWTKTTFTAGQFFASSNLTIAAIGSKALSSNTLTTVNLSGQISSAMNNVLIFVWTDATQAQNVKLDLGNVFFGQGASAPAIFEPPRADTELLACLRFLYVFAPGVGQTPIAIGECESATESRTIFSYPAPMRITPSFTASAASDLDFRSGGSHAGSAISSNTVVGASSATLAITHSGLTAGAAGFLRTANANTVLTFDARL
jgi:hypothetical protein